MKNITISGSLHSDQRANKKIVVRLIFLSILYFVCFSMEAAAHSNLSIQNAGHEVASQVAEALRLSSDTKIILNSYDANGLETTDDSEAVLHGSVIVRDQDEESCRFIATKVQPNILQIKLKCANENEFAIKGDLVRLVNTIVAARNIKVGQRLNSSLFKQSIVQKQVTWHELVAQLDDGATPNLESHDGKIDYQNIKQYIAKKDIKTGSTLSSSDIERYRIISSGSVLTLRYHKNNLTIETPVKSLDDGKVGDLVRVRNIESNKVLRAIVLDEENVAITSK